MTVIPGEGPGYPGSGERATQSEHVVTERFAGSGVAAQVLTLMDEPMVPLSVQYWDSSKELWMAIPETSYTVAGNTITMAAAVVIAAPLNAQDRYKNIIVRYVPQSIITGNTRDKQLRVSTTINLLAADPDVSVVLDFSPSTYKGKITRIVVTRTAVAGTAYTANSRIFTIYDSVAALNVYNHLFQEYGLEPSALATESGQLINQTDDNFGEISFANEVAGELGQITVRLQAAGGAADSDETYTIIVQGIEEV